MHLFCLTLNLEKNVEYGIVAEIVCEKNFVGTNETIYISNDHFDDNF